MAGEEEPGAVLRPVTTSDERPIGPDAAPAGAPAPVPTGAPAPREAPTELQDPLSAMTPRFNIVFRLFAKYFFRHFDLPDGVVARLRRLEQDGSVVYVMRYASRLDYFLMNVLFLREGLRLSGFANGLHFYYYRPFRVGVRMFLKRRWEGLRRLSLDADRSAGLDFARDLSRHGQSLFLFLRTARLRGQLRGRREAVELGRGDLDVVEEVVRANWRADKPVAVVPVALFWRKGPRSSRRFLNLSYGAPTRPSDTAKILSFVTNYRGLAVHVGDPIDLTGFIKERRDEGESSVVRKVRRSVMLFLYRTEKVVEGPTLLPRHRVQETVLGEARVQQAIEARAAASNRSMEASRADAEKIFREIAADQNSSFLAVLNVLCNWIFGRMFVSIEVSGIEKVAEYAKRHPLVLVPSHRSYFDFLILSWMFYSRHLVPPHILARENMAFGPFGFIFRRAGAFFMRRTLDDPLYKEVFRAYVGYLIRQGFTQEFFIEGGRSRTGRTLAPRFGKLKWDLDAFLESHRRDLFYVPIAITYERLVEEGAMIEELEGGEKQQESMLGLVRARKFLQRRFGSVFVSFGEPLSLADAIGGRREAFATGRGADLEAEKRRFVSDLGNRLVERINWATVVNATSVAAAALLGESRRGLYRSELCQRMQEIIDLLRLQDAPITAALEADEGEFNTAIAFLVRADLVKTRPDPREEMLYFEESRRRALDFYRNSILHYLVAPSFLARGLQGGATQKELREELAQWLDLFELEFFTPRGEVLAAHLECFLDAFERFGLVERQQDVLRPTAIGVPYLRFLATQTQAVIEAYYATFGAVLAADEWTSRKRLLRAAAEQFERAQLLGEVDRGEGANPVTFGNALTLLINHGILEERQVEGGREVVLTRGPSFAELESLRDRLASELSPR